MAVKEGETLTDMELLMKIMELREAIQDHQDNPFELKKLQVHATAELSVLSESIAEAFRDADVSSAKEIAVNMTYVQKALEEIQKLLPVT